MCDQGKKNFTVRNGGEMGILGGYLRDGRGKGWILGEKTRKSLGEGDYCPDIDAELGDGDVWRL